MIDKRFDVLIVGSGPAGSIAALVLARGGARVALVDKAAFPRDKACGDLIGPRGVQLLRDLTLDVPDATRVSDMFVVGPTGNRVRLPAPAGRTYPGYGIVVQRSRFDATLQSAAIAAGAEFIDGRADEPIDDDGRLIGFSLSATTRVRADVVVGADGATSRVAVVAGLVDPDRLLWGFAVRTYRDETVEVPHIMWWTPLPGNAFPGYGWVFPAGGGRVNVGLGVGVLADRTAGRRAARDLDAFLEHASRLGVLGPRVPARSPERPLGAWLKMGLVGTMPARDRVLLVGDAAGLVNPLQGEGIAASDGQRSGRRRRDPWRHRSSVRSLPHALGAHACALPVDDGGRPAVAAAQTETRGRTHPRADLTRRRSFAGRRLVDHVEQSPRRRTAERRNRCRGDRRRSRARPDCSKPGPALDRNARPGHAAR